MSTENRITVTTKSGVRLRFALDSTTNTPVFLGRVDDIENTDEHIGVPPRAFNAARRKASAILRRKKVARDKIVVPKKTRQQKKKNTEELKQLKLL